MATNDNMDVRNRTLRTDNRTNKTNLTKVAPYTNQSSSNAAMPILAAMTAGAGTGASAGAFTGPFAPVVSPTLAAIGATAGAGYGLYQNRDKIGTFVRATAPVVKNFVMGIPNTIGRWFGLTEEEEAEVERAHNAAAATQEEQPAPEPQNQDNNPNENPKDKKPSRVRRTIDWVKNHPKTSIAIGAGAFYPTREWVVKPALNYVGPAVGNAVSYITTGNAPFNIPSVANDSTDLWFRGGVGRVLNPSLTRQGTSTNQQEPTVEKAVQPDTIVVAPTVNQNKQPGNGLIWQ